MEFVPFDELALAQINAGSDDIMIANEDFDRRNDSSLDTELNHPRQHRVLFMAPRLFTPGSGGGGERYTSRFLRALAADEVLEIRVIVGESYRSLWEVDARSMTMLGPCSLHRVREAISSSDIVHIHQLNSHIADLALALATSTSTRIVLTDLGGGWRTVGRLMGRHRLRRVSGLAAISQTSISDLHWNPMRPTTILYAGGDHLPPIHQSTEKQYDFLYVGRILPHKGAHLLLEALPDGARCLVVGAPKDDDYLGQLYRMAEGQDVTFEIGVSDDNVAKAYASSRWCVSPTLSTLDGNRISRPELLGITPIEAVVAGTPVILSDIPAYLELAEIVGGKTFAADSATGLSSVLLGCMKSPATPRPPDGIASLFTWDEVAQRSRSLYEKVLSQ